MPQNNDDRAALLKNEQAAPSSSSLEHAGVSDAAARIQYQNNNNHANDDDDDGIYAGGFVADEQIANGLGTFMPATLPAHQRDDDDDVQQDYDANFRTITLPSTRKVRVSDAPPDRFNFTYIIFYLLGIATMTPWNFFVTAEDYWMYKFRNTSTTNLTLEEYKSDGTEELTPMQKGFTCDLTLTASLSGTVFLILNAIYGHHVALKVKMLGTLSIILAVFITTTAFVEVNTDHWQQQFFLITLFTVMIINISSAVMSGGIFGIAGVFPSRYMSALVSGQALGGIFTALAFILVLAMGASPKTTAFIYFIIGSVLIMLCIVTYMLMSRTAFFRYYLEGGDKYVILSAQDFVDDETTPQHLDVEALKQHQQQQSAIDAGKSMEPNIRETFSKIYTEAVCLVVLFATTLSVYPSVSVLMQSEDYGNGNLWNDVYYLPVVNYLFFNAGDYFGRILAGIIQLPRRNAQTVLLLTLARIMFVPFFLCSNSSLHYYLPVLVHSDIAFIIMIVAFALSNGYITNTLLVMAPRRVQQHEREIASSIMAAFLSCGLALGSILSMAFVRML